MHAHIIHTRPTGPRVGRARPDVAALVMTASGAISRGPARVFWLVR